MKTKLLITKTLLILSVYSVNAQVIPNYSFETWSNGANNAPDGWVDHGSKHVGFYPASQSTDHFLGSYSAHLENKITITDTSKGLIETSNGIEEGFHPAFPINTRYTTLKGFYKFIPQNGDSAVIITVFYKTGYAHSQGFGNLLAIGWKNIGVAASVWTPFTTMNIYYDNNATDTPDSAYISLGAFQEMNFYTGVRYPVKGNSALYIDALNYDSFLTGISEHMDITTNFKLFPNANNGAFDLSFETIKSDYTTIKIYDLSGREAMTLFSGNLNSGAHTLHYDVKILDNGNYLFVIATGEGYRAEKLFIQK
ncbi:MAG: T9SS type A sorting domain-containing protein [Bacteroidetes bacterium]|nr:MAG: T9SS type A sorting domain-containing protein [Bacteroidota bacterium]